MKENKAFQKNHTKVGVKKSPRAGMMPAMTWGASIGDGSNTKI